jgi:hypothetical protein
MSLFAEVGDIQPPKEKRGRKKHPNCPVCHTPRNLREQVLDEVLALVNQHDPYTDRATSHFYWGNTLRAALIALKASPIERPTSPTP